MHLKVLGLGLSKTGTTSLGLALEALGYRNYDCPGAISRLDGFDSATDCTPALWWRKGRITADKYIITLRSLDDWLKSIKAHWARNCHKFEGHRQKAPAMWEMRHYFYAGNDFDEDIFRKAYSLHKEEVLKNAKPLLVYYLCEGEGWEPLCEFLDKPIPDHPFPHVNRTGRPDHIPPNVEERCVS